MEEVFRYDALHSSVGYVTAWGKKIDDVLQVYAPQPNENIYPGFFDGMPRAFRNVDSCLDGTGRDRILKAANLYMHFYSAERPTRLESARWLIEKWALNSPVFPVFASDYARAVHSALETARISKVENGYRLADFGACRTVRFDDESRHVDMHKSWGVLGYRHIQDQLFVHLKDEHAEIVLTERPSRHVFICEANHHLSDVTLRPDSIRFVSEAIQERVIVIGGFSPHQNVPIVLSGTRLSRVADAKGRVTITLSPRGP